MLLATLVKRTLWTTCRMLFVQPAMLVILLSNCRHHRSWLLHSAPTKRVDLGGTAKIYAGETSIWAAGRARNPLDFVRWVVPIKARGRYTLCSAINRAEGVRRVRNGDFWKCV
jgi:hypothetical protein